MNANELPVRRVGAGKVAVDRLLAKDIVLRFPLFEGSESSHARLTIRQDGQRNAASAMGSPETHQLTGASVHEPMDTASEAGASAVVIDTACGRIALKRWRRVAALLTGLPWDLPAPATVPAQLAELTVLAALLPAPVRRTLGPIEVWHILPVEQAASMFVGPTVSLSVHLDSGELSAQCDGFATAAVWAAILQHCAPPPHPRHSTDARGSQRRLRLPLLLGDALVNAGTVSKLGQGDVLVTRQRIDADGRIQLQMGSARFMGVLASDPAGLFIHAHRAVALPSMSLPIDPRSVPMPHTAMTDSQFDADAPPVDDPDDADGQTGFTHGESRLETTASRHATDAPTPDPDTSTVLDRVSIRLLVELSTAALSLREISALDHGSTVLLADGAPNEVVIRTENGPVLGTGELVNLDGTLGVLIRRVCA